MEPIRTTPVLKVERNQCRRIDDTVVQERRATLLVDQECVVETVCSPGMLREFAYGHLLASGRIRALSDVVSVDAEGDTVTVRMDPTVGRLDPGPLPSIVRSGFVTSCDGVQQEAMAAERQGGLFRTTGGTHLAAVVSEGSTSIYVEDISRTCALEKALGAAVIADREFGRSMLVLTSRVPLRFVRSAARAGIPIVVAISAPTYQAVEEAKRVGICLCGFARGERLNVYSHAWRVGLE